MYTGLKVQVERVPFNQEAYDKSLSAPTWAADAKTAGASRPRLSVVVGALFRASAQPRLAREP